MTSIDFLNYVAGIGIIVAVGFISYLLYELTFAVQKFNALVEFIIDITKDIKEIEKKIKNFFTKGGEKNMQKMNGGKKHESNPLMVGSVGAVAGAAIGAAAAAALSSRKTRERIGQTISNLRDQAMDMFSNLEYRTRMIGPKYQAMKVGKRGRPKKN